MPIDWSGVPDSSGPKIDWSKVPDSGHNPSAIADQYPGIHPGTSVKAGPGGVEGWLQDLHGDLQHGTDITLPGKVLKFLGAPGLEKGVSPAVSSAMGGELLGPVEMAHAAVRDSTHPHASPRALVNTGNEFLGGAFKSAGPGAALIPGVIPGATMYGAAGAGVNKAATAMGMDPDAAELAGNLTSVIAPFAHPALVKTGEALQEHAPAIGKAAGYGAAAYGLAKTHNPVDLLMGSKTATKAIEMGTNLLGKGLQAAGEAPVTPLVNVPEPQGEALPTNAQAADRFARNVMGMKSGYPAKKPLVDAPLAPERGAIVPLGQVPEEGSMDIVLVPAQAQVVSGNGDRKTRQYTAGESTGTTQVNPEPARLGPGSDVPQPLVKTNEPQGEIPPPEDRTAEIAKQYFNPDKKGNIQNPVPTIDKNSASGFKGVLDQWIKDPDLGQNLPTEQVDPSKIFNTGQDTLSQDALRGHLDDTSSKPLVMFEKNGKFVIPDGNHRVTAALVNGTPVDAKVIHLDQSQPLTNEPEKPIINTREDKGLNEEMQQNFDKDQQKADDLERKGMYKGMKKGYNPDLHEDELLPWAETPWGSAGIGEADPKEGASASLNAPRNISNFVNPYNRLGLPTKIIRDTEGLPRPNFLKVNGKEMTAAIKLLGHDEATNAGRQLAEQGLATRNNDGTITTTKDMILYHGASYNSRLRPDKVSDTPINKKLDHANSLLNKGLVAVPIRSNEAIGMGLPEGSKGVYLSDSKIANYYRGETRIGVKIPAGTVLMSDKYQPGGLIYLGDIPPSNFVEYHPSTRSINYYSKPPNPEEVTNPNDPRNNIDPLSIKARISRIPELSTYEEMEYARDPDPRIKKALLKSSNYLVPKVLDIFERDPDPEIQSALQNNYSYKSEKNLSRQVEWIKNNDPDLKSIRGRDDLLQLRLAKDPTTNLETLNKLQGMVKPHTVVDMVIKDSIERLTSNKALIDTKDEAEPKEGASVSHNVKPLIQPFAFDPNVKRNGIAKQFGVTPEVAQHSIDADPTENKVYSKWIAGNSKKGLVRLPEDNEKLTEALSTFEKLKNSPNFVGEKDIQKYDPPTLYQTIREASGDVSNKQQIRDLISHGSPGAELVGQSGNTKLFKVTDPKKAVQLASNTSWCTSQENASTQYLKSGPLWIVYKDDKPFAQLHTRSGQFMDTNDSTVKYGDPTIKEAIGLLPKEVKYGKQLINRSSLMDPNVDMDKALSNKQTKKWLVNNMDQASHQILEKLSTDPDRGTRVAVALNSNTSPQILEKLASDPEQGVRRSVANNETTPPQILEKLASDPDRWAREAVANNETTPPQILEELSSDPEKPVRERVAGNKNTSPQILEKLASDTERAIRWRVAGNNNTPPQILEKLSTDTESDVRGRVARNGNTPPQILEKLASDPEKLVRDGVAGNNNASPQILEKLSSDPERGVRWEVANNETTPPQILEKLASDPDRWAREAVAGNKTYKKWVSEGKPDYEPKEGASVSLNAPRNTANFVNPYTDKYEPDPKFSADELNDLYRGDILDTMAKTHGELVDTRETPPAQGRTPKAIFENPTHEEVNSAFQFLQGKGYSDEDLINMRLPEMITDAFRHGWDYENPSKSPISMKDIMNPKNSPGDAIEDAMQYITDHSDTMSEDETEELFRSEGLDYLQDSDILKMAKILGWDGKDQFTGKVHPEFNKMADDLNMPKGDENNPKDYGDTAEDFESDRDTDESYQKTLSHFSNPDNIDKAFADNWDRGEIGQVSGDEMEGFRGMSAEEANALEKIEEVFNNYHDHSGKSVENLDPNSIQSDQTYRDPNVKPSKGPVIVYRINGKNILVDGNHRVDKAKSEGKPIKSIVYDYDAIKKSALGKSKE